MRERSSRADVRATFDTIAADFARTRKHPWEPVERFVDDRQGGPLALDIGCGNGRHLSLLAERWSTVLGLDLSRALLTIAQETQFGSLCQGDATQLPIRPDSVDCALYVAALHHIPSPGGRRDSLSEINRVLTEDGAALISVWSVAHDRFSGVEPGDTTVPWTLPTGETVDRYYHLFDIRTFAALLDRTRLAVERQWEEGGNCWAIVRSA